MITSCLKYSLSNEVVTSEPITVADVKAFLNITFDAHDTKIGRLITVCRQALEQFKSVTLIDSRTVTLSWQTFTDYEDLLFYPIDSIVTVTDLDGNAVTDYTLNEVGGQVTFKGEYPKGVKVTYNTVGLAVDDRIKELLVRAVAMCFETDMIPYKAIKETFKYEQIA